MNELLEKAAVRKAVGLDGSGPPTGDMHGDFSPQPLSWEPCHP